MKTAPAARVLIVEDDPDLRRLFGLIVQRAGYQVALAGTLSEAYAALRLVPDIVLHDLDLPDGPGTLLLKQIRSQHLPARVAVISGTEDEELLDETRNLHPDGLFRKPLLPAELLTWMDQNSCAA